MNYKIVLYFMLLNYLVAAFPKSDKQTDNYQDIDDDDLDNDYVSTVMDEELKDDVMTEKPRARYEVTEIVIDIPDNRTKGPIVTNYTIYRPLNTILTTDADKETNENITTTNCREHRKNTTVVLNKSTEGKKNYVSILHVKAEFENQNEKITPQIVDFHHVPHLSGIKDYLNGIRQGIVNGFNSIVHKHKHEGDDFETPGPLAFWSKLQKKNSDTAHKIHDVVFGHTIDEDF